MPNLQFINCGGRWHQITRGTARRLLDTRTAVEATARVTQCHRARLLPTHTHPTPTAITRRRTPTKRTRPTTTTAQARRIHHSRTRVQVPPTHTSPQQPNRTTRWTHRLAPRKEKTRRYVKLTDKGSKLVMQSVPALCVSCIIISKSFLSYKLNNLTKVFCALSLKCIKRSNQNSSFFCFEHTRSQHLFNVLITGVWIFEISNCLQSTSWIFQFKAK